MDKPTTQPTHAPELSGVALTRLYFRALIPRARFVYLVAGMLALLVGINLDLRPDGEDSGLYFMFWSVSLLTSAMFTAVNLRDLLATPLVFGLPHRASGLRPAVFTMALGLSLAAMLVTTAAPYAYWAPDAWSAYLCLIPIGMGVVLLVTWVVLRMGDQAGWIIAVFNFMPLIVQRYYFDGVGRAITRPPESAYLVAGFLSICWLVYMWRLLDHADVVRGRFSGDGCAGKRERLVMVFRKGDGSRPLSAGPTGAFLLARIAGAGSDTGRVFWSLIYRIAAAVAPTHALAAWTAAPALGLFLALHYDAGFQPLTVWLVCALTAVFQGTPVFDPLSGPMLPFGRRDYVVEAVCQAVLRLVPLAAAMVCMLLLASVVSRAVPQSTAAVMARALLDMPAKSYACLAVILPLLLWLWQLGRSPIRVMTAVPVTLFFLFQVPGMVSVFRDVPWWAVAMAALVAWMPFATLTYMRRMRADLALA